MKSLVFSKEKELALALMKVAELTAQLDQLRGASSGVPISSAAEDSAAPSASRHSGRPASTGSIHEQRHSQQRVVVKPTTAPPPPPVAAAAVLSPAGDKVINSPVFILTCGALIRQWVTFSALTLLVGRQEGHPACKMLGIGLLGLIIRLELCTDPVVSK